MLHVDDETFSLAADGEAPPLLEEAATEERHAWRSLGRDALAFGGDDQHLLLVQGEPAPVWSHQDAAHDVLARGGNAAS